MSFCLSSCLPGSTGDELKSGAVPEQPPSLSSHSDDVRRHGFTASWTFPHIRLCDQYHVCGGFRVLRGWVFSLSVLELMFFPQPQTCCVSPSLSVLLLYVAGLTLMTVLFSLALFSFLVSVIVNAFYVVIFNIFRNYPSTKVRI